MTLPFVCRVTTTPGWNNEIKSIHTDYCFDDKKGWHVGITVMMRVILVDGTFHEDLGFGAVANARSRGDALMQAKKVRVCVCVPWPLGRRQATARGGGCATEAPRRQKQLFSTSRPGAASLTPSSPFVPVFIRSRYLPGCSLLSAVCGYRRAEAHYAAVWRWPGELRVEDEEASGRGEEQGHQGP